MSHIKVGYDELNSEFVQYDNSSVLTDSPDLSGVEFTKFAIDALADRHFGKNYQSVEAISETSTTSTAVWSTKLTLTTPSLQSGNYILFVSYKWQNSGANRAQDTRVQRNSSDALTWVSFNPNVSERSLSSAAINFNSISGVQTITLQFKVNGSGTTTYMSDARLNFWRVS